MDMTEPLISRTMLMFIWAGLGFAVAVFLTFVKLVRGDPLLTTQTNQVTGIKHHGIMTWALFFLAVFPGPPVAMLAAGWMVTNWWTIPVVGFIILGAVFLKRWKVEPQEYAPQSVAADPDDQTRYLTAFPAQPAPPAIWSAPPVEGNWDPRRNG
jgi:hypothetical protein